MAEHTIRLKCSCGANAEFVDKSGTYIKNGGVEDEHGRVWQIEIQADRWLKKHNNCLKPEIGQA